MKIISTMFFFVLTVSLSLFTAKGFCNNFTLINHKQFFVANVMSEGDRNQEVNKFIDMLESFQYGKNSLDRELVTTSSVNRLLQRHIELINQAKFKEVHHEINDLTKKNPFLSSGARAISYYYDRLRRAPLSGESLNAWCEFEKKDYLPYLIRGLYYYHKGWEARGSGFSYTVRKDGNFYFKNHLQQAKKDFENAYSLNPEESFIAASMILINRGLGESRDDMEGWFKIAIFIDPLAEPAYINKRSYLEPRWHGSFKEANDFAMHYYANSPKGSFVYMVANDHLDREIKKYVDKETYNRCKSIIMQRLAKDSPGSLLVNYTEIKRLQREKKFKEAIALSNRTIKVENFIGDLYLTRGMCYFGLHEYDNARNDLLQYLVIRDHDAYPYYYLGVIEDTGFDNLAKAEEYFTRAIELEPTRSMYFARRSRLYTKMKKYKKAITDASKSLSIDPFDIHTLNHRAYNYSLLNQNQKAIKDLQRILELDPGNKYANEGLNWLRE